MEVLRKNPRLNILQNYSITCMLNYRFILQPITQKKDMTPKLFSWKNIFKHGIIF